MGMLLFEAYGVHSLISGGLCLRCLKLWNLCMITTLFTEIWRYAMFLNEVLYNSSFELSQWRLNRMFSMHVGFSQLPERTNWENRYTKMLFQYLFFLPMWCLTLCDCFFFSLKTFFLMKNILWKYQILALPLSSKRTKSFEVQTALYCNNILFVLMHVAGL